MELNVSARSPLRISFAGGGTDVEPFASQYGSAIVSATINLYAEVEAKKISGHEIVIDSISTGEKLSLTAWNDKELQAHLISACSLVLPAEARKGLHLSFSSPVAPGSGLGASSALVVAMVKALLQFHNQECEPLELAKKALHIERIEMNIAGGFQDQFASAFGGINYIESNKSQVFVTPIEVPSNFIQELHDHLILADLSLPRKGQNIILDQQRNIHSKHDKSLSATLKQLEYGKVMRQAFIQEDIARIGETMSESWKAKRDFSEKISTPRIDQIFSELNKLGILGAKITGAGGGGHLLIMTENNKKYKVKEYLQSQKIRIQEFEFTKEGATSWSH